MNNLFKNQIIFLCAFVLLSIFFIVGNIFIWTKIAKSREVVAEYKIEFEKTLQEIKKYQEQAIVPDVPLNVVQLVDPVVTTVEVEMKPIPASALLDVPFTSQAPEKIWDQPWQDACEEAAILMLDAYYKKYSLSPLFAKDELQKMVDWETARGWGGSVEIEKVKLTAEWYIGKKDFKIIQNPTVEDIKRSLVNKNPVLVVADGKALPNPNFRSGGPIYHALLVIGYNDETGEFVTNDPGTQFGAGFRYKYDDLMNSIRDWNGGDVPEGKRVVLVVK